jgi:hypothetical protein
MRESRARLRTLATNGCYSHIWPKPGQIWATLIPRVQSLSGCFGKEFSDSFGVSVFAQSAIFRWALVRGVAGRLLLPLIPVRLLRAILF